MRRVKTTSAEEQLEYFIGKYTAEIAALGRASINRLRQRLPGAVELVYDNYNALVIGFSPTERASDAVFSIALYPRWVTLFFLQGSNLPDPAKLLRGKGKVVRSIVIDDVSAFDKLEIQALIRSALEQCKPPIVSTNPRRLIIKSISKKQRPRQPVQRNAEKQ